MSEPGTALRVVLADDSYIVREGVTKLLDLSDTIEVVGQAEDRDALIAMVDELTPDVVITDIRMPPNHSMEGIEAAHEIRAKHPTIGIVVLSQYVDDQYALALLRDGSSGMAYLLKDRVSDLAMLLDAVAETARGGSVLDPAVVEALVRRRMHGSPLETLTPRELEVLQEMARGRNNAAIGEALYLTERAVEKHINSIFRKLGLTEEEHMHRRVAAVLLFLEGGSER